jgi:phosphonate transport system ATP-binding protein
MSAGASGFSLKAVTVDYGRGPVLKGLDLDIQPGEAVAFVGPSGAGKTSLLKVLTGSVRPRSGSVAVDGRRLDTLSPGELRAIRARVGFIHQDLALVPNVRVIKNVLAGRLGWLSFWRSLGAMLFPPRGFVLEAHRILERVGIGDALYERTDRLSGGQQQRVAIARALFQEPAALVADEPVSSVDPARARDVIALLTSVAQERGLTLCASLHDVGLAREFFPRLVGLRRGAVAFDGPADRIPPHAFDELYDLESDPGPEDRAGDGSRGTQPA